MRQFRIYSRTSGSYTISVDSNKNESYIVCPICSPYRKHEHRSDAKLNINLSKEVWRCNHCGEGGRIYEKDDIEIRKELIKNRGLTPLKKSKSEFDPKPLSDNLHKWVTEVRKISEKALYALRWREAYAVFRDKEKEGFVKRSALCFQVYIDGVLVNIHYRDSHKNFTREKAADTVPYNWDSVKGRKRVFLVEGEIDVGAVYSIEDIQPGWISSIGCASVPNGTTITEAERAEFERTGDVTIDKPLKLEWLTKMYDDLKEAEEIVICTDDDAPGVKLRKELARRLGIERCKYVTFTHRMRSTGKPCKDSDDVLMDHGPEALLDDLNNAKHFPSPNIVADEDAQNEIDDLYENGMPMGLSLGYPTLDPHFTMQHGYPYCFYGWPGHGKTTVALNLFMNMAVLYGWNIGIYCPENYPPKLLYSLLMEIYSGKSFRKEDKGKMNKDEYLKAKRFVINHFKILNNDDGFTIKSLLQEVKILIRRNDIDAMYIDPWNALNLESSTDVNIMNAQLNRIVRFGLNNGVAMAISVHPNTPDKKVDSTIPPNVFQLEGGLIWNKKMYSMVCIHQGIKEDYSDTTLNFDVTKNKWHKTMGIPTSITGKPVVMKINRFNNRLLDANGYSPLSPGVKASRTKMESKQLEIDMMKNAVVDNNSEDWV